MASGAARDRVLRLVPSEASGAQPHPDQEVAPDDSELLAALRAGDASAASAFHDRVRPCVDRTLRRLLGVGHVDHQDLAQNALIELVTTIQRFRGSCSLDAWVSTLTSRVVYKAFRRNKIERRLFSALTEDQLDSGAPTRSARSRRA